MYHHFTHFAHFAQSSTEISLQGRRILARSLDFLTAASPPKKRPLRGLTYSTLKLVRSTCGKSTRSRASAFDQANAVLDSNSREAWGEMKMRPKEWELG